MYLLDTVILSELRKRDRDPGVVRWIEERRQDELFVSVISLGEVERGIVSMTNFFDGDSACGDQVS